jgi:F-type H+-transporting ATPase subunit epsilon
MQLDLLTPEGNIFSGDVYGVQMPGVTGTVEVLQHHAPMIAALKDGKLKILQEKLNGGQENFYDIQSGFVEVLNNKITVLVESAKEV